jgi:NADH:ubiquinone oxidoreductase subunit 6 (subunit J)
MPGSSAGIPDQAIAFYLFAIMAVVSAWGIVFSRNLVRSASLLLLTLGGVAGLFFLLKQEFLAAVQLIVYAGGTLILIVFTVLLTARANLPQKRTKWAIGASVTVGLLAAMGVMALFNSLTAENRLPGGIEAHPGAVSNIGKAMLGAYLVPFQLTGLVLLLVMIGASYLARKTGPAPAADPARAPR